MSEQNWTGLDPDAGRLMSRYTDPETILAERYVSVLDFVSRCAQAVDEGNWAYLWDKTGQLREAVDRFDAYLSTDPDDEGRRGFRLPQARPDAVRAAVTEWGRHYRAGRLLHPATVPVNRKDA